MLQTHISLQKSHQILFGSSLMDITVHLNTLGHYCGREISSNQGYQRSHHRINIQHQWRALPVLACTGWFTNPWTLSSGNTACAGVRWVAYFPFCRRERQKLNAAKVSRCILIAQQILSAVSILFTYFIWFRALLTLWVKHFVVQ